MSKQSISLNELIQQVKKDLLASAMEKKSDPPLFFVESVELELHVAAKREGKAGIKIDVLSIGGGEVGGGGSREQTHTIKVQLSPLFEKEQILKWYKDIHGSEVISSVKSSMDAMLKGSDEDLEERFGS